MKYFLRYAGLALLPVILAAFYSFGVMGTVLCNTSPLRFDALVLTFFLLFVVAAPVYLVFLAGQEAVREHVKTVYIVLVSFAAGLGGILILDHDRWSGHFYWEAQVRAPLADLAIVAVILAFGLADLAVSRSWAKKKEEGPDEPKNFSDAERSL